MSALLLAFFSLALASYGSSRHLVAAGDCPLDFSRLNFTVASEACSNKSERGKCCRYINSFVALSIAHYAKSTGELGVPPAFSEICLSSFSDTLNLYGIPAGSTVVCGLGSKVRVSYQCQGRATVLEMMQSPDFSDVINTCQVPLALDSGCRRCLNSGIIYLHNLIPVNDNVTLSVCRDAVFVTLASQDDEKSIIDMATCFFGIQGLSMLPESSPEHHVPESSPTPVSIQAPMPQLVAAPVKKVHHSYHLALILGVGVGVIAVSTLLLLVLILMIRRKSMELRSGDVPITNSCNTQSRREGPSAMLRRFSYSEMKKATEGFSTVIGKGGYGIVYRAQFSDGSLAAVKRMNKVSKHGEEEFCREMELLARLHHRHLVMLKGFCVEKAGRFLVYEYMENGSLKDHLHSSERDKLSWNRRLQIAIDVANALEYLHYYCDPPLCHRDIKSSNILLDENLVAKVADFGLAHASRNGAVNFEPVNTDIRGTPGYMDPEYAVTQELTEKSDIYSYGVLLLELISGRKAIQDNRNVVEWSQKFMASVSKLPELVDPVIRDAFDGDQLHRVARVAQCCTQRQGRTRPSIKQVLRMLSESLDPIQNGYFLDEDDNGHYGGMTSKTYRSEVIPYSGDGRCLQSSSSTSRSYCSRSGLLENSSPKSPPGIFSLQVGDEAM